MSYLLDTIVISELRKGDRANPNVLEWFSDLEEEEILIADCDPRRVEHVRRNWPFLRDRRIDAYGDITGRWLDE